VLKALKKDAPGQRSECRYRRQLREGADRAVKLADCHQSSDFESSDLGPPDA
jgi:hypothetical protein